MSYVVQFVDEEGTTMYVMEPALTETGVHSNASSSHKDYAFKFPTVALANEVRKTLLKERGCRDIAIVKEKT